MKKIRFFFLILAFLLPQPIKAANPDAAAPSDTTLLWLVNAAHRLPENYAPAQLSKLQGFPVRNELIAPFNHMIDAMAAGGLTPPHVQSAYRDYRHQRHLFTQKQNFYAAQGYGDEVSAALAAQTVALPGASEHQTGLALDVTLDGMLRQNFGETAQGKWLDAHAHEFGFVVRYPRDKIQVTGIIYEPWHLRYVGVPHAALMKEKNLCFEEYLAYLKLNGRVMYHNGNNSYYLMFFGGAPITIGTAHEISVSSCGQHEPQNFITTMLKLKNHMVE